MRNDVKLDKWSISAESKGWTDDFLESVFFTGNGRMGARGYLTFEPHARSEKTGMFIAGIFGELKSGITDFVNLPTPVYARANIDGHTMCDDEDVSVQRTLDLSSGLFTAEYVLYSDKKSLRVREERFFSLCNTGLLVQRITLTPSEEMDLRLYSGVHTECCNLPVPDDQTQENMQTVQLTEVRQKSFFDDGFSLDLLIKGTKIEICEGIKYHTKNLRRYSTFENEKGTGFVFTGSGSEKTPFVIEQCVFLPTSRDKDPRIHKVGTNWDFDSLLCENISAWSQRWQSANIEVEGDSQTDAALRYSIFELIANNSEKDSSVSIGARGLTHTRYKGCYFWDTDMFMMPFYLYTTPEAARNLMLYRTDTLPQAKKHAQKMNCRGARYPWMTSYDGSEQCESWDIGASELHVTADVVHALNQYVQTTGDEEFYAHGAAKVYIETARFWQSRYTPEPGTGRVNLLFCKGPDEYCGITSNNLYTNMLVKENLRLAQKASHYLYQHDRQGYINLEITPEEVNSWKIMEHAIKLPKDPVSGNWRQDDTFHLLEPVSLSELKQGESASYRRICFDRLQRYKVIKQADVLLLMSRLPKEFTAEEKRAAWNDFEPLCLHDSTLSFATHALFAAQNGIMDKAQCYFKKALFLDLHNVMENTGEEGLHLACLGEVWQAAILGFGGLSIENDELKLIPHLPRNWEKMRFRFFYRGKQYQADVGHEKTSLQIIHHDI